MSKGILFLSMLFTTLSYGRDISAFLPVIVPSVSIFNASDQQVCSNSSVTFMATPVNGGLSPSFQWKKNGVHVGTNSPTFTSTDWVNADVILCVMTSSDINASPLTATSNVITVSVPTPTVLTVPNLTLCTDSLTQPIPFLGTSSSLFTWTNSNPAMGLSASGVNDIPTFKAINSTGAPMTTTITVTPSTGHLEYAYITNVFSGTVSVINTMTHTIVATIPNPNGSYSQGITVSPSGHRVYITNFFGSQVSVIDPVTNTIIGYLPVGDRPYGAAVMPDESRLYVVNSGSNNVSVINLRTHQRMMEIPVGRIPEGISITPNGTHAYVANSESNSVSVINTATHTVIATIPTDSGPDGLEISPDGTKVYVACFSRNTICVISTATQTVVQRLYVGSAPHGVAFTPDGRRAYIANANSFLGFNGYVSVINATVDTLIQHIFVGYGGSRSVCVSADGKWAYITNFESNTIVVINTATHEVETTILNTTGRGPYSLGKFIARAQTGCTGTPKTFTITVLPTPTIRIGITASSPTVCRESQVTFTATPINEGPTPIYQWYRNRQLIHGATQVTYTGTNWVDSDSIHCVLTNTNASCSTTAQSNKIHLKVPAQIIGKATGCSMIKLTAIGGVQYNWSGGATPNAATNRFTTSGVYTVTITAATGCTTVLSETVSISPNAVLPTVHAMPVQTVCAGRPTPIVPFSGLNATSYSWVNDNPNIGLDEAGDHQINSFIAENRTGTPITAQISVTPTTGNAEYAYIANTALNQVSVIHLKSNTILTTIPVGNFPMGMAIHPNKSRIYVANRNTNTVSVINTLTHTVIATIPVGDHPQGVAFSPDGSRAYVNNTASQTISVINTTTHTLETTWILDFAILNLLVSPNGRLLYADSEIINGLVPTVKILDATTGAVISDTQLGWASYGMCLHPTDSILYMTNLYGNDVTVMSTRNNALITRIPVGREPYGIVAHPNGTWLYVANSLSHTVSVINTNTNTVQTHLNVDFNPRAFFFNSDATLVYVTNYEADNISVIDTRSNRVVQTIQRMNSSASTFGCVLKPANQGCEGNSSILRLTVMPAIKPTVSIAITSGSSPTCGAGTLVFTATPTNGGATPTYQWHTNRQPIGGATHRIYTGTNWVYGDTIHCVMTNMEACVLPNTTGSNDILVLTTANVEGAQSNCAAVRLVASGGNTYQWSGGATPTGAENTFTTSGTYSVTITNPNGCVDIITRIVVVDALPSIHGISPQTFCTGVPTLPIPFTGANLAFTHWSNSNPAIGLSASGMGTIPSFIPTNPTNTPMNATITVTPASGLPELAYIVNSDAHTLSVINTANQSTLTTIHTGTDPIDWLVISPEGQKVYIGGSRADKISIISTVTHTIVQQIPTLPSISAAIHPNGKWMYVVQVNGTVAVVHTTTYQAVATLPVSQHPSDITLSPDGSYAYVSNRFTSNISVINTKTNRAVGTLEAGSSPQGIAVTPNGRYLYVANYHEFQVSVIDVLTRRTVANILTGRENFYLTMSPDGSRVYTTNRNFVYVINTATNTVMATIPVRAAGAVSVSPDGNRLYVTMYDGTSELAVIHTGTNTVITKIPIGQGLGFLGRFIKGADLVCSNTPTIFNMTIHPKPVTGFTYSLQAGTSSVMNFTNMSLGSSMFWEFGDNLNSTSTAVHPTFWYQENGTYGVKLKVMDTNGCVDSITRTVVLSNIRTDLNDVLEALKVSVSPNPFSEHLSISIENQSFTQADAPRLIVTNSIGQRVFQSALKSKTLELDTQFWVEGIYQLTLESNGYKKSIQKIVKVAR